MPDRSAESDRGPVTWPVPVNIIVSWTPSCGALHVVTNPTVVDLLNCPSTVNE